MKPQRKATPTMTLAFPGAGVAAEEQVAGRDWNAIATDLSVYGCAVIEELLTPAECAGIASA